MKKVWVSDKTTMVLQSLSNIGENHSLYRSFCEKEVDNNFHVNVYGNAMIYDDARVYGNAEVHDDVIVYDNARVFGDTIVYDNAVVGGNAIVYGVAEVYGKARVLGNAIATKRVINIIGLIYDITLTDKHIQIGCKQFTFEHAKKLADRNIDIDDNEYNEMIKHKDLLLALIDERERDSKNENDNNDKKDRSITEVLIDYICNNMRDQVELLKLIVPDDTEGDDDE